MAKKRKTTAKTSVKPKTGGKTVSKKAVQKKAAGKKTAKKKSQGGKATIKKATVKKARTKKSAKKKSPTGKKKASGPGTRAGKKTPTRARPKTTKKAPAKKVPTGGKKLKPEAAPKAKKRAARPKARTRPEAPTAQLLRAASSGPAFTPYKAKQNEEYMNDEQKAHFREILLQWKHQLMEEVDRTVNHMQDEATNYPDPADRASQEEEFSLELKTRDRERKLIRKIDNTLELIDQDNYGYCESCGVEIGVGRLEARPTATQCIDCKTLDEIKERQTHG